MVRRGHVHALARSRRRLGELNRDDAAEISLEEVPCNICGGNDFSIVYANCPDRLFWLPGRFNVVRCRECSLVQTNPRPDCGSIGSYYSTSYPSFCEAIAPHERSRRGRLKTQLAARAIAASLTPYTARFGARSTFALPSPGANRLLEIGSGAGYYLGKMLELGWDACGIEPDADAASLASEHFAVPRERIRVQRAEDAEFNAQSFDLVRMTHVLEHLHDPKTVLSRVRRWLKPTGTLVVACPNFASLESKLFRESWRGLDIPRHLYHFSPVTLDLLLQESGLERVRVVPEPQTASLSGSVSLGVNKLLRRRRLYRHSRALHYVCLPLGSLLLALGSGGSIEVSARPLQWQTELAPPGRGL